MTRYRDWKLTTKIMVPVGSALALFAVLAALVIHQQRTSQVESQAARMAQALALQIAEDRTYYTKNVVGKLKADGLAVTPNDSRFRDAPGGIPLPATFVKEITETINKTGHYKADLVSASPINKAKGPRTPFEREALARLARDPKTPARSVISDAGGSRLVYVTADVAQAQACVSCHNAHPESPRRDFAVGDVMGALV